MEIVSNSILEQQLDNIFNDYNELKDIEWVNLLNSLHNIPLLNNQSLENNNNILIKKKIRCSVTNCSFKNYKDNMCRFHYNKKHNLLCSIYNCNNMKKKDNLCYKHIKPICCILYCKCYAMANEVLCKKHKKFKIELNI